MLVGDGSLDRRQGPRQSPDGLLVQPRRRQHQDQVSHYSPHEVKTFMSHPTQSSRLRFRPNLVAAKCPT